MCRGKIPNKQLHGVGKRGFWTAWFGAIHQSWESDRIVQGNQSAQSRLPSYLIENNLPTCHIKGCHSSSGKWPGVLWEPGRVLGPVSLLSYQPSLVWEPWVPFGTVGSPASSDPPVYILDRVLVALFPAGDIHPSSGLSGCTSHTSLLHRAGLKSGLPGPCPSHEFFTRKGSQPWGDAGMGAAVYFSPW